VSQGAKDLVSSLLTVDPAKLCTSAGVFESEWYKADPAALQLHIPHFSDNMRKYNLRRKFKGAVLGIMANRRMSAMFLAKPNLAPPKVEKPEVAA